MLNGLDLFSGIGGLTLALGPWVRPVAYCEIDRYAQGVLLSRMADGNLPVAPIWDDIRTLRVFDLPDAVDIIYGGFPCQDLSIAGNGAGLEGERSRLFFEVARLVREIRPSFVFLENVAAIAFRGLDRVAILTCTNCGHVWPAPRDARKPPGDCPLCHEQELAAARAVVEAAREVDRWVHDFEDGNSSRKTFIALTKSIVAYDKVRGKGQADE